MQFKGFANMGPTRAVEWLACAAALGVFAFWTLPDLVTVAAGEDLASLVIAGQLVRTGQAGAIYAHDQEQFHRVESESFLSAARTIGFRGFCHPFVQAPLVAWGFAPLSALPFEAVRLAWLFLSLLALAGGFELALRMYAPRLRRPAAWAFFLLGLSIFEPVRYGLWIGQTTPLFFFLVLLALWLERRGSHIPAGLVLAVPGFVKLSPILLGVSFLARGSARSCVALALGFAALAGLSLAVAGIDLNTAYLDRIGEVGNGVLVAYNNHSLLAFVTRFQTPAEAVLSWRLIDPGLRATLVSSGLLALGAIAAALSLRRIPPVAGPEGRAARLEAHLFVLMLLAPGLSWSHYFLFLVPPLLLAIDQGPPSARGFTWALALAALALCSRPLLPDYMNLTLSGSEVIPGPTLAAILVEGLLLAPALGKPSPLPQAG